MSGNLASISKQREDVYVWVLKRILENRHELLPDSAYDIIGLVQLLQHAGFDLQKFEVPIGTSVQTKEPITLQITGERSGVVATMTIDSCVSCNCFSTDEMKMLALNSKLTMDPIKKLVIKDVFKELILMIGQTDNKEGNQTWEVDPNITPPTDTSSPMPDVRDKKAIEENLLQIQSIAAGTLKLMSDRNNTTFTKKVNTTEVRVSNIKYEVVQSDGSPGNTHKAAGVTSKISTPLSSMYKNIPAKVNTFNKVTKSSPVLANKAKKPGLEKSKIPGIMLQRTGSVTKTEGPLKYKSLKK